MRFLPLFTLLLVAASPAKEKKKPAAKVAKKAVSLEDVVKVSLKKGNDWALDEMRAKNLGYENPPATKEYVLDAESAPTQHAVMVTLGEDSKTARDVMLSSTTAEYSGGQPVAIDGYTFRADLNGQLVSGIRARGPLDSVMQEKLDPSTPETKKRFDAILATVRGHQAVREAKK